MIIFTTGIIASLGIQVTISSEAESHQSGCHRWHSCPSHSGSYTCGDLGHECKYDEEEDEDEEEEDDDGSKSNSKSESEQDDDGDDDDKNKPTLPKTTLTEGIEISGPITSIVDGDTLDVNDIPIRLSLVDSPEVGEEGFYSAKDFVEGLCLGKSGEVDIDDGQRQGSFGREIGIVYCDGVNVNEALMQNNLAVIDTQFCTISEFAAETWADTHCTSSGNAKEYSVKSNPNTINNPNPLNLDYGDDQRNYELVTKWGSSGRGEGQFNHPASIDTDENGQRVYVADLDNHRIQVLDGDGNFITEWGKFGKGDGQFNGPGNVAVDSENKVVFVADIKNNRIEKFDLNGNYISQWGKSGSDEGQFDHPGDIALDPQSKQLYITDIYNNRIQKFNYDGNFTLQWGSFGTGVGEFNRPAGMSIDPIEGYIYVSDTVNDRIQVFDVNGNFVTEWGSPGSGNGQFNRPDGIFYEPSEKLVYVADRKNNRIQVFENEGNFIDEWIITDGSPKNTVKPRDVVLDNSGQTYVVDKVNSNILIYETMNPLSSTHSTDASDENPKLPLPIFNTEETTQQSSVTSIPETRHGKSYFTEEFESHPDDSVYVVSHSTKRQKLLGDLYYDLVGEIKNIGSEEVNYVKIIATFYDKDDIVIGTDYTFTEPSDLSVGEKAPYDLSISDTDLDVGEIAKAIYKLEWD